MNAIILAILLAAPGPLMLMPNASGVTSYGASGLSCFHDADNSVSMCVLTDDTLGYSIYGKQRTDDANALGLTIKPEAVSPFAAAAKVPSDLKLAGGADSKTIVWDNVDPSTVCGGTSVTYSIDGTSYTQSYGVAGVNGYCSGGCNTKALAAASFAAALDARAGISASVGTVGADTAGVGVTLDGSTAAFDFTSETAACTTYSNGTNGMPHLGGLNGQGGCIKVNNTFLCSSGSSTSVSFGTSASGNTAAIAAGNIQSNTATTVDGTLGFKLLNTKGATTLKSDKAITLTFPGGGAASMTSAGAIPQYAQNVAVTCRTIVTGTGAGCLGYDVGAALGENQYLSNVSPTAAATAIGPRATIPGPYPAAGDLVISAVPTSCNSLSVRCTLFYDLITSADTAN